jgi:hypothetical protein
MRRGSNGRLGFAGLALVLGLVAAACANDTETPAGDGGLSLQIVGPTDGDSVTSPFEVKVDASVDLGTPETGEHHVHLCFDGANCSTTGEYTIGYADTIEVKDLPAGEHTIEASLRNADHSDAGVSDTITVTVAGSGGTGSSPTESPGRDYGY